MNNNIYAVTPDDTREYETVANAREIARRSGKKEADAREHRERILDYYSRGKKRRTI